MIKVLITGGSGFIGSHLAEQLLAREDHVAVIDSYFTARRDSLVPRAGLTMMEGTVADAGLIDRVFTEFKPDVVVHAAASYKDPQDWEEDIRTNIVGTLNVVRAAGRVGIRRLIYFQTALCYGLHPTEQPVTLNHPLRPEGSSYAITKTAAEHFLALSGLEFLSFRLANVYGPRNLAGPLPTFYQRLMAGKKCFVTNTRRDFIFISDLVDVVLKAADGVGDCGYYHISSGRDSAIQELFDETVSALGITLTEPVEVRERGPDDAFSILLDPSKTEEVFRWRATTPLAVGVRQTIQHYRQFGVSQTFTHLKPVPE